MGGYTYSYVVVKKGYPHPEAALKMLNVQNDLSYGLNDAPQYYPDFNSIWSTLFPIPFLIEQPYVVERMGREYQQALDGTLDPATFNEAMKIEYGQIQTDIAAPRQDVPAGRCAWPGWMRLCCWPRAMMKFAPTRWLPAFTRSMKTGPP